MICSLLRGSFGAAISLLFVVFCTDYIIQMLPCHLEQLLGKLIIVQVPLLNFIVNKLHYYIDSWDT